MAYLIKRSLLFFLLPFSLNVFAQTTTRDFKAVDEYVQKLGSLDSLNMGTISNLVTKPFSDKVDKLRAIYYWIANNISYDCKAARTGNTQKNSPTEVLLYRRAVGIGFASLFQDMSSSANIRCLTADGFVKTSVEQIGETKAEINHSWAVVQLGQSPDTWFYIDPALGSGTTDNEMKLFTKSFNGAYFFADKTIFNLQHYPDNEAWKLGAAPKNKKDFYELPFLKAVAYDLELKKINPTGGKLKIKLNNSQSFNFILGPKANITQVTITVGEKKKQKTKEVNYSFTNGTLNISYKFDVEGNYPLLISVNGKEFIAYSADVE